MSDTARRDKALTVHLAAAKVEQEWGDVDITWAAAADKKFASVTQLRSIPANLQQHFTALPVYKVIMTPPQSTYTLSDTRFTYQSRGREICLEPVVIAYENDHTLHPLVVYYCRLSTLE